MRKIILYGVGIEGEKFYWAYRDCYEIVFCIDKMCNRSFHDIPVYDFVEVVEKLRKKDYFIVIAASIGAYTEISVNLQQIELKEYKDFIASKDIGKKLAVFYGNCHVDVLQEYLNNNPDFNRQYIIKYFFLRKEDIPEEVLECCELLVLQDIQKENRYGCIDAEKLCNMVNGNCLCIKIPNVYGKNFFFPQLKNAKRGEEGVGFARREDFDRHVNENAVVVYDLQKSVLIGNTIRGLSFEGGDENIERLYRENKSIQEIADYIEYGDAYEIEVIQEKFKSEMQKLMEREKQCDICISDYILENYRSKQLFYEPNHPTFELIREKGRRILELLSIEIDEGIPIKCTLDGNELFIYGCVKKALGITFKQKYIRKGDYLTYTLKGRLMDLEEYVEDYVRWVCERE